MSLNPRRLILNLLQAADGMPLSATQAVGAAALFGIRDNSVRVTLARLSANGLVASAGRGLYQLGPQAADLAEDLAHWRELGHKVVEWQGQWLGVSTAALPRSDRVALRVRERALALLGFRELSACLHVRPDNLAGGAAAVRLRLHKLGLQTAAPVFALSDLDPTLDKQARSLWADDKLNQGYQKTRQSLSRWLARAHALEPDVAARESFLLGDQAIHQWVFDPLLPAPLVDTDARQAFAQAVDGFDRAGHLIWQRYLASLDSTPMLIGSRHAATPPHPDRNTQRTQRSTP